jgi:hypothetical protein
MNRQLLSNEFLSYFYHLRKPLHTRGCTKLQISSIVAWNRVCEIWTILFLKRNPLRGTLFGTGHECLVFRSDSDDGICKKKGISSGARPLSPNLEV